MVISRDGSPAGTLRPPSPGTETAGRNEDHRGEQLGDRQHAPVAFDAAECAARWSPGTAGRSPMSAGTRRRRSGSRSCGRRRKSRQPPGPTTPVTSAETSAPAPTYTSVEDQHDRPDQAPIRCSVSSTPGRLLGYHRCFVKICEYSVQMLRVQHLGVPQLLRIPKPSTSARHRAAASGSVR